MAFNGEIYEIFSWLPPKLLYEISATSKHCAEFLTKIGFVEKQCRNSLIKPVEHVLIQDDFSFRGHAQYLQLCSLSENTKPTMILSSRELKDLKNNCLVVGSSNGLLLCLTFDCTSNVRKMFVCNPTTKGLRYIELPSEDIIEELNINLEIARFVLICGKNYCKSESKFSLDYTILLFNISTTWSNCRDVYVVDEGNNWVLKKKDLYIGPGNVDFQRPVHCIDGLYFLSDSSFIQRNSNNRSVTPYYVLHYDIDRGTSRMLALPDGAQDINVKSHIRVGIFGWEKSNVDSSCFRSICFVKVKCSKIISIWTLDISKKLSSWQESFVINKNIVCDLGITDFISWQPSFAIIERKLIIGAGRCIYSYPLDNKVLKVRPIFKIKDSYLSAQLKFDGYSSTLRPCDKGIIRSSCRIV
ncbi:hypothetical protein vseg_008484 [Gypsophila vaccaria]